ncbi:TIGR02647 family protein [methane-oxidizing endosymbiont of Gigantopelta aegis]|uniref:TIGR02647 family protein n=1 Tax=methane-oxidizing endosymbiont of Gigantopelta aegis TaxID=2794938 RepID=UPI0018DC2CE5|nr:TIGR02647 family protein [methane-oxidizing endosymbiont of Gigantopelta aegis]
MALSQEIIDEINLLALFNLESIQEGIKVHTQTNPQAAAAAERLFKKGIVTQQDGGYLTDLGIESAEHLQRLLLVLQ